MAFTSVGNYMRIRLAIPIYRLLKATSFWQDNGFIFREFKYFRRMAILALVFMLIAAGLEGFGIGFILSFLQSVTAPNAEPIQTGIRWFDTWILGVNDPVNERIYRICALIIITTLLRSISNYLGQVYSQKIQLNVADRLRKLAFEQLQGLSLIYFAKTRSGDLINSLTAEIYQLIQAFSVISFIFTKGSILLVYIVSMLLLSWQLTLISVMMFTLLSVGMTTLLGQVREASFERTRAGSWYTSISLEFINGIRTIKSFAAQDFERRRFYDASAKLLNAATKSVSAMALIEPLSEGASIILLVGMLVLAFAFLIQNGLLESASLLTFLFVLLRASPNVRAIDAARAQFNNYQGALSNIKELLRTDNKIYLQNGKVQFSGLKRAIEFIAVDFGYDPNDLVLRNICLTIERGKMTALVGGSGAGKSTLADLIPRFYDPTQGKILIDGIDLREFEINSLRRKVAVVSQDTFIFNTSVRNNIAYAMEEVDEVAIRKAAQLANALEFIQELPEGFDTQLGDRGVRLSGGQRQRIAIARALLRDPDILILDEATSALDSISERLIQASLEKLSEGRTVIAIAHRLSTIVRADKVVVLEQGRIVEQGRYQELLEQRGKLWKYHQLQHELGQVG
ncbi:heterocyst formation ABC transporter subunit HepA [Chlorogloeopsis fritschii PCC 9212]|uniref:HlyB/MsbA family ABC transporter n=1 Tax=Chlorogloeopsis fritschii PCC 6912 TaxID=211165 RepID=A0A3S0ZY77_CHLFR|nr:heterocyst formation ABC transporter subunit HepA [Chlorogloeopsis fritschii]MBF2007215.1 ABC transporter ATP-binding protein [Chlorogloeopsis fritschii C42_A2020_084]RUR83033.1 HlyB/MsbA family ABC transporter [Chlorogloeopsis fritschii PCC 6912]